MMRMQAVFQGKKKSVVGFSISGEREDVIYLLREAYKKGAKTILFTAKSKDSFKKYCSEVVLIPSLRHLNHGNVISPQFPILIILDIIYAYYMEQNKQCKERACMTVQFVLWKKQKRCIQNFWMKNKGVKNQC